jgi:hypothetical protein
MRARMLDQPRVFSMDEADRALRFPAAKPLSAAKVMDTVLDN